MRPRDQCQHDRKNDCSEHVDARAYPTQDASQVANASNAAVLRQVVGTAPVATVRLRDLAGAGQEIPQLSLPAATPAGLEVQDADRHVLNEAIGASGAGVAASGFRARERQGVERLDLEWAGEGTQWRILGLTQLRFNCGVRRCLPPAAVCDDPPRAQKAPRRTTRYVAECARSTPRRPVLARKAASKCIGANDAPLMPEVSQ